MKDKRFWFGVGVSGSWLAWMGWQLYCVGLPKDLNAQGDFFAGFFAPLAFLWLVIGYLQQGEELRQSTEALRLQAAELKNSVEQQSQLVAVSKQQLDQATSDARQQQQLALISQLPRFLIHPLTKAEDGRARSIELQVENVGRIARRVVVSLDQPQGPTDILRCELMQPQKIIMTTVRLPKDTTLHGRIKCLDEMGVERETEFQLKWDDSGTTHAQPDPFVI